MQYEYKVYAHPNSDTFDLYLNMFAVAKWEPFLFSYHASQTGVIGGYACVMRRPFVEAEKVT